MLPLDRQEFPVRVLVSIQSVPAQGGSDECGVAKKKEKKKDRNASPHGLKAIGIGFKQTLTGNHTSSSGSVIALSMRATSNFKTRARYAAGGSGVKDSSNMCLYNAVWTSGRIRTLSGGRSRFWGSTSWKYWAIRI